MKAKNNKAKPPAVKRKGGGSKPHDPSGRQQILSVALAPAEKQYLLDKFGTVSGGLRRLLHADMREEARKEFYDKQQS